MGSFFFNKSIKGLPQRLDLSTQVFKELKKPLMEQTRLITLGRRVGRVWEFNSFQGERGRGKLVVANRVCKGGP